MAHYDHRFASARQRDIEAMAIKQELDPPATSGHQEDDDVCLASLHRIDRGHLQMEAVLVRTGLLFCGDALCFVGADHEDAFDRPPVLDAQPLGGGQKRPPPEAAG